MSAGGGLYFQGFPGAAAGQPGQNGAGDYGGKADGSGGVGAAGPNNDFPYRGGSYV